MVDTLAVAERLQETGIPEQQAKAIARELAEKETRLATKDDIARLEKATKDNIARSEKATKDDIARLEKATKDNIARLEKTTKDDIADVKEDVARLERRMDRLEQSLKSDMRWLFGITITVITIGFAILPRLR